MIPDIFRQVGEGGEVQVLLLGRKVDGQQVAGVTLTQAQCLSFIGGEHIFVFVACV